MKKDEIIETLNKLKDTVDKIKITESNNLEERMKLRETMINLYGSIQEYYVQCTGNLKIEVPIGGSKLKSTFNNYFEAGYLSGRTFHTYLGYSELLKVIGIIKSKKSVNSNLDNNNNNNNNNKYSLSDKIGISSVLLIIIGGAFALGMYIGAIKFDQKKIDLIEENKQLKIDTTSLGSKTRMLEESILKQQKKLKETNVLPVKNETVKKISVSYYNPISIFNGQVLIKADSYSKELTFKGIKGLDKAIIGNFKKTTIIVEEGDRFFIKLENNEIWIVNVMNLITGIDLEILKQKTVANTVY